MNTMLVIQITQIVVSVLIIALVSIQGKGAGLSQSVGRNALYSTRRGAEKVVFYLTIVCGVVFASLSVATLLLSR